MNVVFRTDASLKIGAGHLMRCLTLADELRAEGARCHFICRNLQGNLIEQTRQRGFTVSVLSIADELAGASECFVGRQSIYAAWLGVDWDTDATQTISSIGGAVVDWLVVDHYALDFRWEQNLRPMCRRLMVIDDLADRPHDCDVLLDQNLGRNVGDYCGLTPGTCTVLAGSKYALLRPQFAELRDQSLMRRERPELKHLLVCMGGVDQVNATGAVLEALVDCNLPRSLRISVVMGLHAPWLEHVRSFAKNIPQPIEVMVNINNMAQLMAESDLAISAAGGGAWERCCLGLPSIIVTLAENQRYSASALMESGSAKIVGCVDDIKINMRSMIDIFQTTDALSQLSRNSRLVTDGRGVSHVKDALYVRSR